MSTSVETMRQTEAQEEAIKAHVAASQPLVGPVEPISVLRAEYAANPSFAGKIDSLCGVASSIRRARGDGNCFYRSYCFAIMEWAQRWLHPSADAVRVLRCSASRSVGIACAPSPRSHTLSISLPRITNGRTDRTAGAPAHNAAYVRARAAQSAAAKASASAKYDAFLAVLRGSAATLGAQGYSEMVFEDYLEEAVELFEAARTCSRAELEAHAADETLWNGIVFFVKLLAAAQMKGHRDDFVPFIEATTGLSLDAFCTTQVEAMWVECDHLQIVALAGALGLGVKVWYLDGAGGAINGHVFPEESSVGGGDGALVHLLFRPGHYDILHVA